MGPEKRLRRGGTNKYMGGESVTSLLFKKGVITRKSEGGGLSLSRKRKTVLLTGKEGGMGQKEPAE